MNKLLDLFNVLKRFSFSVLILAACTDGGDENIGEITITALDPATGPAGTIVNIAGTGFAGTLDGNTVKFNGKEASVIIATETLITAEVPNEAETGPVTVTVENSTATGPVFTYLDGSQVTQTYYIKFKANGVWKVFEVGNPGYQSCGNCACSYLPPLSEERYAGLDICQANNDWIVASDITGWNTKTINFMPEDVFPVASFGYTENSVDRHTQYAANQTGSKVQVTGVVLEGSYFGKSYYKVSGTFQCKVAASDGGSAVTITEGIFVVRFSED